MANPPVDATDNKGPLDPNAASTGPDTDIGPASVDDVGADPEDASVRDWVDAENSRPTLPDETADGLDEMDEEVRHQAEDMPLDTAGRLR